ncbi:MAG: DegT/DnrJ/EryC1/StrS family aminotransferase, partial [FCB group bacterium]|nr:DegT/DnrJ/EryC1/StrS family aminotransferase [FCB group bacterium]
AVVTNDDEVAGKLRLLRLHGMTKTSADREREGYQHWDMVCMGWKYNMDNIHAAILLAQFKGLEDRWRRRQYLAELYFERLTGIPNLSWPVREEGVRHGNHLFTIHVPAARRDEILTELIGRGVGAVINYRAIHLLTYFRETFGYTRGAFPNAELIGDSTITLPLYCKLPDEDVVTIAGHLRDILGSC